MAGQNSPVDTLLEWVHRIITNDVGSLTYEETDVRELMKTMDVRKADKVVQIVNAAFDDCGFCSIHHTLVPTGKKRARLVINRKHVDNQEDIKPILEFSTNDPEALVAAFDKIAEGAKAIAAMQPSSVRHW